MKGFALDANGDLLIKKNDIQMIEGAELTRQTVKTVLSTNKGEWSLNIDEGINFKDILGKKQVISATDGREAEIHELKQQSKQDAENANRLNELLAKRLDGEL